jgi:hypothetical protein
MHRGPSETVVVLSGPWQRCASWCDTCQSVSHSVSLRVSRSVCLSVWLGTSIHRCGLELLLGVLVRVQLMLLLLPAAY